MRALMNFMHRDGWSFHILAEDCKTVLVGYRHVASRDALLRIMAKLGGSVAEPRRISGAGTAAASGSSRRRRSARRWE